MNLDAHTITRDEVRVQRIRDALVAADLELVVVTEPANVLLISGYWPVLGTAVAIVNREGRVEVVVPRDEEALARRGWADQVTSFVPASLHDLHSILDAVRAPLRDALRRCEIGAGRVGLESGRVNQMISYVSMFHYGSSFRRLLEEVFTPGRLQVADRVLERLGAVKTPREIDLIRAACEVAAVAYDATRPQAGWSETEVAAALRGHVLIKGTGYKNISRSEAFAFCMSGPNSAQAYGAYAFCTPRRLERGDLVMIHCNNYADGFWTDITRTYCLGHLRRKDHLFDAVLEARAAALVAIRPGATGADVDEAARSVLRQAGLEEAFLHAAGHGVGFASVDAMALPRIHPKSEDVLEEGMVFNIKPAVYLEGEGGVRHCDVVAVTSDGYQVLSPFHDTPESLVLP